MDGRAGSRMPREGSSRAFWDRAARRDAEWYVATATARDKEAFFRQGAAEVDSLLAFCGIETGADRAVLEIGCGVGRMTRRLADLYGRVVALDVSPEMLERARDNVAGVVNIEWILGSGHDLSGVDDASVDAVFSYITLQHVPSRVAVLRYLEESSRVLRAGGRGGLQVRRPDVRARVEDFVAQAGHAVRGRATLARAYRGVRIPAPQLSAAGKAGGCAVTLRPRGTRHLWVILDKVGSVS